MLGLKPDDTKTKFCFRQHGPASSGIYYLDYGVHSNFNSFEYYNVRNEGKGSSSGYLFIFMNGYLRRALRVRIAVLQ